jgi:hypothetical protein
LSSSNWSTNELIVNYNSNINVLATPSITLGKHDPNESSGCSQSNKAFAYAQLGPAFVQINGTSSQISGANYTPYNWGPTGGVMEPAAKFDPGNGKAGMAAGAGFVHQWSCTI